MDGPWPDTAETLIAEQLRLAAVQTEPWPPAAYLHRSARSESRFAAEQVTVGGCWVCFPRGLTGTGAAGEPAWAAAVVRRGRRQLDQHVTTGLATGPYAPGLLALREGPLLEAAVRGLRAPPDVLLVNATGRDHPRRAGLAVHLGAVLAIPTVGVTDRPLVAAPGPAPRDEYAARSPLSLDGEIVAYWLRTRVGRRPVLVHPGWRVPPEVAVDLVVRCAGRHRTPAPLREARRLAREARAHDQDALR